MYQKIQCGDDAAQDNQRGESEAGRPQTADQMGNRDNSDKAAKRRRRQGGEDTIEATRLEIVLFSAAR